MTLQEAYKIQVDYDNATKSGAYLDWDLETLIGVQKQLREARVALEERTISKQSCEEALRTINASIVAKRAEQSSSRRHTQTQWIAGIGIVLTALGILLAQYRGSKQPAMPQRSRTNAETPKAPVSPIATPSPTQSTTPEPTYSATATPSEKPQTEQSPPLSPKA